MNNKFNCKIIFMYFYLLFACTFEVAAQSTGLSTVQEKILNEMIAVDYVLTKKIYDKFWSKENYEKIFPNEKVKKIFMNKIVANVQYNKSVWISILKSLSAKKLIFEIDYEKKLKHFAILNSPSIEDIDRYINNFRQRDEQIILRALNGNLITRKVDGASFYVTEEVAKDVLIKFDDVVPRIQRLFSPSWVEDATRVSQSLNSICQDLKKIAYLAAVAHLSSNAEEELNELIVSAKNPNEFRPKIDDRLVKKATFWGYSSHGNAGDGLKSLDAAKKDAFISSDSVYEMCLRGQL